MKPLLFAVLALLAAATVSAQDAVVILSNPEQADFHYVLDPPELAPFDPFGSIFPSVVRDYFAAAPNGPAVFEALPAGGSRRLEGLEEGTHLFVGFFVEPGEREFPVRVIRVEVGEGLQERHYSVYRSPALVAVQAGQGRLDGYPAIAPGLTGPAASAADFAASAPGSFRFQIDNRYEDWDLIPALAAFPGGYRPESFVLERFGQELQVLPLSEARHWRRGGTALCEVKIVRDERAIYLYASTHEAIAANMSVFLYLHGRGAGARANRLTVELVPAAAGAPGLVVLWEKGQQPFVAGPLTSGTFFLEAEVPNEVLLPYLESLPDLSYFDLTTCYFDRSSLSYEEFYFGSPSFAEIPTADSLF